MDGVEPGFNLERERLEGQSSPDSGNGNGPMYCANHPNRETYLRCNKCGKPICPDCAVHTPVGYRCRECVRQQQNVFYNIRSLDYILAAVVSPIAGFLGALLVGTIGWFTIFLAPVAGGVIAEVVRWAARGRRGRYLWLICAGGVVLGTMMVFLFVRSGLWSLLWLTVFAVMSIGTIYARLR
jgi:hypothetical protein